MDLNSSSPQTLSDSTYDYIYGNGRIAQVNGAITFAQGYAPYGAVNYTSGSSSSSYGFTNEYQSQGKIYLRARHYVPLLGRFLTRDTWGGDANSPMSFNRWSYTEGNPINYTDPSGHITRKESYAADKIADDLKTKYNVIVEKDWGWGHWSRFDLNPFNNIPFQTIHCEWWKGDWRNIEELRTVQTGVEITTDGMGGSEKFKSAMHNRPVNLHRVNINGDLFRHRAMPIFDIVYSNYAMSNAPFIIYSTAHEFGHIWDIRNWFRLSNDMGITLNTIRCISGKGRQGTSCDFDISRGKEPPPGERIDPYAGNNALEDWAEAFANKVYPSYYGSNSSLNQLGPIRRQYVQDQIDSIP